MIRMYLTIAVAGQRLLLLLLLLFEAEIRDLLGQSQRVLFALFDRDSYAAKAQARFEAIGYELERLFSRRRSPTEAPSGSELSDLLGGTR